MQFYDISFGVREINERDFAGAGNFHGNDFADSSTACLNYFAPGGLHIINRK